MTDTTGAEIASQVRRYLDGETTAHDLYRWLSHYVWNGSDEPLVYDLAEAFWEYADSLIDEDELRERLRAALAGEGDGAA